MTLSKESQRLLNESASLPDPNDAHYWYEVANFRQARIRELEAEVARRDKQLSDLSKCSDGRIHILYAIESGGWVEEVGCERCTFKIAGRKSPDLEFREASATPMTRAGGGNG